MNYLDALKTRRSHYALKNTITVPEEKVIEVITDSIKHTPSPYNTQTTRAMILLGKNHAKLWNIVKEVLLARIGPERFVKTEAKIDKSFMSGYGTVLFFIDDAEVEKYAKDISEKFYGWANESAGMAQINVWNGLSSLGLGASLQHYNPIIDDKTKIAFDIPESWKLISQMPFGDITEAPGAKVFKDINEIVRVKK
jgi:predicted oxidoreductase (fatty acid repression mutant protein)